VFGPVGRLTRFADLDDQVAACRRVFASDARAKACGRAASGLSRALPSSA
jgi:hypothetical protein